MSTVTSRQVASVWAAWVLTVCATAFDPWLGLFLALTIVAVTS